MTADNEAREQTLCGRYLGNDGKYMSSGSKTFWCDQPKGHADDHLDSASGVGYENVEHKAALASRPAVPAAIGELIAEARAVAGGFKSWNLQANVVLEHRKVIARLADALEVLLAQTAKSVDSPQHKD